MATNTGKKGGKGASLADQIARLTGKMTPDQIAEAQSLAANKSIQVRLAFKLLKEDRGGLTARQYGVYKQLLASNKQVADEWRTARMTENAAKKAAKVAKGKSVVAKA